MIHSMLEIMIDVVLPIFLIIGCGTVLDRLFKFDVDTLSKLNFYLFVPVLVFVKILESEVGRAALTQVGLFVLIHIALMLTLAFLVVRILRLKTSEPIVSLGTTFYNCGNFGIPLVAMAFAGSITGGSNAVALIAVVIMIQNLLSFLIGILFFEQQRSQGWKVLLKLVKVPVIYVMIIGWIMNLAGVSPPVQVQKPLNYLADGLIPMALITLGVQLGRSRVFGGIRPVLSITLLRLVFSPLAAFAVLQLLGIEGRLFTFLMVISGLPTAVNVFILAAEYKRNEELASRAILWTTVLSAISLAVILSVF